ncbi:MAG: alpha-2-macroglobulin family protein, partial [Candidatus Aminicenantales bacterium]
VHLRDPRPSGCEPVTLTSGYKWDLGLGRYEEIRDSGTNFFMEWLPEGEYTLKHRIRCAMAGTFKAAPATLESMYAPEFAAYSAGVLVVIR